QAQKALRLIERLQHPVLVARAARDRLRTPTILTFDLCASALRRAVRSSRRCSSSISCSVSRPVSFWWTRARNGGPQLIPCSGPFISTRIKGLETQMDLAKEIQRLKDIESIRTVIAKYGVAADAFSPPEMMRPLFARSAGW